MGFRYFGSGTPAPDVGVWACGLARYTLNPRVTEPGICVMVDLELSLFLPRFL